MTGRRKPAARSHGVRVWTEGEAEMQSIHLQGIGQFTAKPARDLREGDTTVWNGGSTAKVVTVRTAGKSVYVVLRTEDGKEWPERRFLGSRLVACTGLGGRTFEL